MRFLLATLICLIATQAAAKPTTYIVHGPGLISCGTWTQDRQNSQWIFDTDWVMGYLSAYNKYLWKQSGDVADHTDSDGILAWIDGYCAAKPLNTLSDATDRLIMNLQVRRMGGSLNNEYGP